MKTPHKSSTRAFMPGMVAVIALFGAVALLKAAGPIMPDFSTVPAGWTVDRYDPASFENVGTFEGRDNVLGIGIDETTGESNRGGLSGLFYSTQGRKFTFDPPAGADSVLSADLYIPASWSDSANGHVRTDMWGTMVNAANAISAYPIIGFSNYGGAARLRVWDSTVWVDLDVPITYDAWTAFAIEVLDDSSINFYVNGELVYTDTSTGGSVAFKEVIMQAYNFDHTGIADPILVPYTAHWSNTLLPPTNDEQCKNGGWMTLFRADYTPFRNQGACVSYVQTGR